MDEVGEKLKKYGPAILEIPPKIFACKRLTLYRNVRMNESFFVPEYIDKEGGRITKVELTIEQQTNVLEYRIMKWDFVKDESQIRCTYLEENKPI